MQADHFDRLLACFTEVDAVSRGTVTLTQPRSLQVRAALPRSTRQVLPTPVDRSALLTAEQAFGGRAGSALLHRAALSLSDAVLSQQREDTSALQLQIRLSNQTGDYVIQCDS